MDWAELPNELIDIVSKKFDDLVDLTAFSAVCKNWRAFASRSDPACQLPWLLQCHSFKPDLNFFCSNLSTRTLHLPEASGMTVLGAAHGYLLTYDHHFRSRSLVNPLTKEKVPLSGLKLCIKWCSPVYVGTEMVVIVVITDSLYDHDRVRMLCCKPCDSRWRTVKDSCLRYGHLYYKGYCYINTENGTLIADINTGDVVSTILYNNLWFTRPSISKAWGGTNYLAEVNGEILLVFRAHDEFSPIERYYFDIHRLEEIGDGKQNWVQISSIGDHILFLDEAHGLSVKASHYSKGWSRNNIYFLRCVVQDYQKVNFLCRYDIEVGQAEQLSVLIEEGGTWFVPSRVEAASITQ